ncbi:HNH endonuclease [Mycobacterium gordonae]
MSFRGKPTGVHRVAWILEHGEIPEGLGVLHRCDVPNCVNTRHLFLGTSAENNADRDQKGRHVAPRGSSRNGAAKLGEYQVIEIRDLLAQGLSQRGIAARYGVQQATVWRIATGKGWKHVPERATHEHPEAS